MGVSNVDEKYVFQFKGKRYECIGETKDFDIKQYKTLIEWRDWTTIKKHKETQNNTKRTNNK